MRTLLQMTEIAELTSPLMLQDYFVNICSDVVKFASNSVYSALIIRIRDEILIGEKNVKQSEI